MALETPSVAPVPGFLFSAVSAGLRRDGRLDLGLILAEQAVPAAGVFTRNRVRAAPVELSAARVASGRARAVLVNSGGANACTGAEGRRIARSTTSALARLVGAADDEVLVASTGVIGQQLPEDRLLSHLPELVSEASAGAAGRLAVAICTTDRWTKVVERGLARGRARLLLVGKGAGMIHPDLGLPAELPRAAGAVPHATLLAFVCTDARLDAATLATSLRGAVEGTLNAASVDGDTSTNDTVLALASGASGVRVEQEEWREALESALGELARELVRDGEGADHVVEVLVTGLASTTEARAVARSIATSLLVKTALAGRDANWGRIVAAAGRAGVPFDPDTASLSIAGVPIVRGGVALGGEAEAEAQRRMTAPSFCIELSLGTGPGQARYLTCDLGHGYVDVNASYRS